MAVNRTGGMSALLSRLRNVCKTGGARSAGILLLLPAGLLLAAPPSQVQKTIATTAAPRISIWNTGGKVIVKGWDRLQVSLRYALPSPQVSVEMDQLPAQGPAEKLHFTTYFVDHTLPRQTLAVDYTLQVPKGASLEIRNPHGLVEVNSIHGDTSVNSLGGNISVSDAVGSLAARSVGGNINVIRPSGRVEVYSVNGNLHFVNPSSSRVHGTTTSGDIVYEGNFQPGGDYVLSDYSGNMEIVCPPTASFELNAKTVRGKVDNSFPLNSRHSSDAMFSSANSLFGTYSTGEATLELTSFSGTIRIHQK